MKNLIFILALFIVAMTANGQTDTKSFGNNTLIEVSTDYTITNTTVSWFLFKGAKNYPVTMDYQVLLTKGTGSHSNIDVALYGRKFSSDEWTQIGNTVSTGNITTTYTATISNVIPLKYREFKVSFTGTGVGTTTISNQTFKLWLE